MCVKAPSFTIRTLRYLIRNNCGIIKIVAVPSGPTNHKRGVRCSPMGRCTLSRRLPLLRPRGLGSRRFVRTLHR